MNQSNQLPPPVQMREHITGFWTSCCIYVVAQLGIADLLASKPQTAHQLAEATQCHAAFLYRVLRALASIGIFSENESKHFELTPLGATLRSDVPGSMRAMAIAQLTDFYKAWGSLLHSVKTGDTAFDHVEGMPIWAFYETHPEEGVNFMKAMTGLTQVAILNVIPAYDFSPFRSIVDVGGGNGALLFAVLKSAPTAKGTVFDEAYVVKETNKLLDQNGLSDRCETVSGSFFDFVPPQADAYLMKMILHDWDDEQSRQILRNCCQAMGAESKLLVIESVLSEGNAPHPGKLLDINMMVVTGGRERTEKEFASLFGQAGLKLTRIVHTPSPMFSIIEAIKM